MRNGRERAEHYRNKAKEARMVAESLKNAEARRFLLTVVSDYLMMADALENTTLADMLPASE